MPRIPPSTLHSAFRISPHAATLLPTCRDLPSTLNELRWIREHVAQCKSQDPARQVASLCRRRGRGEPLQYVLGSQPFGDLDIVCRPGVLIPRPEPEAYTTHLAHLLLTTTHTFSRSRPQSLTILDLCTGTGCIALLLHSLLVRKIPRLHIRGIDISPCAVQLSRDNMQSNIAAKRLVPPDPSSQSLVFREGDIFSSDDGELWADQQGGLDVLICNPPYISSWGFTHETERSVRKYEPKLAQVPMVTYPGHHKPEDVFYARLLDIGVTTRAQVMLFEVGHLSQALRVVELALGHQGLRSRGEIVVEIWRDWPDAAPQDDEETLSVIAAGEESREVRIKGSGHGRSVFIQCK